MSASVECQLLVDPPGDGAWNMAVDEVLFNHALQTELPILRFYQWERPTLSLGYFQKIADRDQHLPSRSAEIVRRLSGGGAILHDHEVTYSLVLPASHPLSRDTQSLYNAVHNSIVDVLNVFLHKANSPWQAYLCERAANLAAHEEPFLCFQRRSVGDILLRNPSANSSDPDRKVVGSAQRRRHSVVLQHGSILLSRSILAPELPGAAEIAQLEISPAALVSKLLENLSQSLNCRLVEFALSTELQSQARRLQQQKYGAANWTDRR